MRIEIIKGGRKQKVTVKTPVGHQVFDADGSLVGRYAKDIKQEKPDVTKNASKDGDKRKHVRSVFRQYIANRMVGIKRFETKHTPKTQVYVAIKSEFGTKGKTRTVGELSTKRISRVAVISIGILAEALSQIRIIVSRLIYVTLSRVVLPALTGLTNGLERKLQGRSKDGQKS